MKSPAFSYYQAKDLADAINIKKFFITFFRKRTLFLPL